MFAHISMERGSVDIETRVFSPEHAYSSVSFLTESLKAAGTKDTSVQGAGGRGVWAGGLEGEGLLPQCCLTAGKDNCLLLTQRDGCISMTYTRYSSPLLHSRRCHSGLP